MPRTKTMISASVLESDEFVDMSLSAQSLYMHLMFCADGLGCIDAARRVIRSCGACDGDYSELLDNGFVITVESPSDKADVIAHWFVHNNLNDRDMSVGKHVALVDTALVFCNRNDRRYVSISEAMPKGYARIHDVIDAVKRALFGDGEPNGDPMETQWEPNGDPMLKERKGREYEYKPEYECETPAPASEVPAPRQEPCPECGKPCLVADEMGGLHGYCPECDYDFFIGESGQ